MTSGFLEGLGALLASGVWVITLMLLVDRLLGVPFGLLIGTDAENESRVRSKVSTATLKRRLLLAPVMLLTPTAAVALAALLFAGKRLHSDLAWYLVGLALLGTYSMIHGSVYWLRRLETRTSQNQSSEP